MRALDLFCVNGGAALGLMRAGYDKAGYRPVELCGFHADEWRAEPGTLYMRRRRLGDNCLPPPRWGKLDG